MAKQILEQVDAVVVVGSDACSHNPVAELREAVAKLAQRGAVRIWIVGPSLEECIDVLRELTQQFITLGIVFSEREQPKSYRYKAEIGIAAGNVTLVLEERRNGEAGGRLRDNG